MKFTGEVRGYDHRPADLNRAGMSVHPSPCYDFIVSLRALYNPDTYERARLWGSAARKAMGPALIREGRPFFAGAETALGLGLLRLVPALDAANTQPSDLIELLRATSAEECALLMLATDETSQDALGFYRTVLHGGNGVQSGLETKTREYAGALADSSVEVLRDPVGSHKRIVSFLEQYLDAVFAPSVGPIREAVERAAASARDLLTMQPTVSSVEALTGGYTLSAALRMNELTLAPSVFIYPFMASRVDEREGRALIVFGVRNDDVLGYREFDSEDVLDGVKALASPHRLQILTTLRRGPLLGTEIIKHLELSQPTVHHHLAQLRSSGLIRQERTNEGMLYSLRPDAAEAFVARLEQFLGVD